MLNLKDDYVKTNYDYIYKHKTNGTYAVVLPLYDKIYNKRTMLISGRRSLLSPVMNERYNLSCLKIPHYVWAACVTRPTTVPASSAVTAMICPQYPPT